MLAAMARTPIVVGNWKLHKNTAEGLELVTGLKNRVAAIRDVEVGVAPVSVYIGLIAQRLGDCALKVFGQNCYWENTGPFTGEVSAALLADAGADGVIVGHSERRTLFGESDGNVGKRARAGLDAGLRVIVCVGETEAERDAGTTESRVAAQLDGGLAAVEAGDLAELVIAYEPVWAIGTGRTATPEQAQEVHAYIRGWLGDRYGDVADSVRIQYGGSVKPDNAAALMAMPDIDGALVGGAALQVDSFVDIVKAARPQRPV
jgi:triosephosphate isomerase